jgi:hypothetical protein
MKIVKTLLLTAAVLISASAYAGSVKLPKADPLIGHWCLKQEEGVNGAPASIYERMQGSDCGSNVDVDGYLSISKSGYSSHEVGCSFIELNQLHDGWLAISKCGFADEYDSNAALEFRIVGRTLHIRVMAVTEK